MSAPSNPAPANLSPTPTYPTLAPSPSTQAPPIPDPTPATPAQPSSPVKSPPSEPSSHSDTAGVASVAPGKDEALHDKLVHGAGGVVPLDLDPVSVLVRQGSVASMRSSVRNLLPDHKHYSHRAPWLRAAVLGANDGLVTVSSIMLGVGAGGAERHIIFLSGLSSLVAGALSMAVGEYVSVSSQRDAEEADLARERTEFDRHPRPFHPELNELAAIYESRGLPRDLARQVAEHFHATFAVDELVRVHARDELGIDTEDLSNAWQAALFSMVSFAMGGVGPLLGGGFIDNFPIMAVVVVAIACVGLAVFGAVGARLGGAPMSKAALRVLVGGLIGMGITFGIGKAFGTTAA